MKKSNLINLLAASLLVIFSLSSMAGGHIQPKPKCPLGQIAQKNSMGDWVCKEPSIKAKQKEQRGAPAGPKPKCPMGQLPKMENGQWVCKDATIKAKQKEQRGAPAGPKPRCPKGQLPKMENGQWVCRTPGKAAPSSNNE